MTLPKFGNPVALARRTTQRAIRAFPWSKAPYRMVGLHQLVFRSQAATRLTPTELQFLLDECRWRNRSKGLTGMLLHHDGEFVQCLEGPEKVVLDTFARISRDPRLHSVDELIYRPIDRRSFPGWGVACAEAEADPSHPAGLRLSTAEWEFYQKLFPRQTPGLALLRRVWGVYRHAAQARRQRLDAAHAARAEAMPHPYWPSSTAQLG